MTLFIKELFSIGAVDAGDNPEAEIVFWKKRKAKTPDGGETEKGDRMEGLLTDLDLSALPDDTRDELLLRVEKLAAERDEALAHVEPEPEPVEKQLDPDTAELIAKAKADAEEARAELAIEKARREKGELVAKITGDGLDVLLGAADQVADTLAVIRDRAPEQFDTLYANLTAAAQRVDLAKTLGLEIGENPGEPEILTYEEQRDAWVAKQITAKSLNPDHQTIIRLRSEFAALNPTAGRNK